MQGVFRHEKDWYMCATHVLGLAKSDRKCKGSLGLRLG